jgi:translation initiation factor 3 subunit A
MSSEYATRGPFSHFRSRRKRFKQTPLATLEPIMERFLSLCTSLRKPRLARDALGLYRIAAQSVSVQSVEKIINKFIAGSEEKLAKAQAEAKSILGEESTLDAKKGDVEDDLELPLQPDTLLMDSLVVEEVATEDKDRVERSVVNPWMRFCWEAYKSCLDVCKSNSRLEVVYQNIALQAFNFCKIHDRRSEFRRLCEQIRKELQNAQKYSNQTFAINFADVDTLSRHLDLRFIQLDNAIELELWQEAFRSVEDIHGLLVYPGAKRATKASMMANYYNKLTKIFTAEGGSGTMAVFHAAAWSRYLSCGDVSEKTSAATLLSALAIPLYEVEAGEVRNGQRLVALLNLSKMPTRKGLLAEIVSPRSVSATHY